MFVTFFLRLFLELCNVCLCNYNGETAQKIVVTLDNNATVVCKEALEMAPASKYLHSPLSKKFEVYDGPLQKPGNDIMLTVEVFAGR